MIIFVVCALKQSSSMVVNVYLFCLQLFFSVNLKYVVKLVIRYTKHLIFSRLKELRFFNLCYDWLFCTVKPWLTHFISPEGLQVQEQLLPTRSHAFFLAWWSTMLNKWATEQNFEHFEQNVEQNIKMLDPSPALSPIQNLCSVNKRGLRN